jgi:methionyl-tRNA formyltransferase
MRKAIMRILFLGNNRLGLLALRWLVEQGEPVVGLVLHPAPKARHADEIRAAARLPNEAVFDGSRLKDAATFEAVRALRADLALSVLFGYILEPRFLELFPAGVINLHPSFLPYNRGVYPNVWSIVDQTPAGASLHYIDAGVDTGDLIAQRRVSVDAIDTGQTLYEKLERAALALLQETWPLIKAGRAPRLPQPPLAGTAHRVRDVAGIDEIDLNRSYRAGELIDILRARTFPPYPGAYFHDGERRIYLRLQLLTDAQLKDEHDETGD